MYLLPSLIFAALDHLIMVSYVCLFIIILLSPPSLPPSFPPLTQGMSSEVECDNGTRSSLTLAIDVLSFVLVTVQIILLDTQYSDQVADEINEKETDAVK